MYAVIRTGGKQYRVAAGDILEVEKLDGEVGDTITLDDVLLVSTGDDLLIGQPNVADASVAAKITGQHRGKKIRVFRYRPKKRIRVRRGHRQHLTRLEIASITAAGKTLVAPEQESANGQAEAEEADNAAGVPLSDTAAAATMGDAEVEATAQQQTDAAVESAVEDSAVEDVVTDEQTLAAAVSDTDASSTAEAATERDADVPPNADADVDTSSEGAEQTDDVADAVRNEVGPEDADESSTGSDDSARDVNSPEDTEKE